MKKPNRHRFTMYDRDKTIPFSETLFKLDLADENELDGVYDLPFQMFYANAKHERKQEREKNMPWLNKKNKRFFQ